MQTILNNPYRVLGIAVNSGIREQTNRIKRLGQYIAAGQEPPQDDYSFPVLGKLTRTNDSITEASSKLYLDKDKMLAALFWFYKGNEITDEPAFDALKEGDIDTAFNIWEKLIIEDRDSWKTVTERNYSAFHNYFVVNMLRKNGNITNAITANLLFLESDLCQKFVSSVTDPTFKITKNELQLHFLNEIWQEIGQRTFHLTLNRFMSVLNKVTFSAKEDFIKNISQKFVSKITAAIETSRRQRTANKAHAASAGERLHLQTRNDLDQLKSIAGPQDFAYSNIADKVANEILQCSIDFFNDSQDKKLENNYHEKAEELAKLAQNVAVGNVVKGRIDDSLQTLQEMKNREIKQAIEALQMIKDTYEKNEQEIRIQVAIQERNMPWGQTINWSKVDEIISNSINWNKVNELLREVLSDINIEKIRNCTNDTQKQKFVELAEWVKNHSSSKQVIKSALDKYYGRTTQGFGTLPTLERIPRRVTPSSTTTSSSTPSTSTPSTTPPPPANENNTENILFVIGIIIWILMFLLMDEIDGTWMAGILYPSFIFFAMWYTPITLIRKVIRFFKNK